MLTGCGMEEAPLARVVSFANVMEAHELVVDVDEAARRFVWSVGGGRLTQHNASMQIVAEGLSHPRVVWIADLLPNDLAGVIAGMIEQGLAAMQKTLEC